MTPVLAPAMVLDKVTMVDAQPDAIQSGHTILITGGPGSGKTSSLRFLAQGESNVVKGSKKRVLYVDCFGNFRAVKNVVDKYAKDLWHWIRPVNFKDLVQRSWEFLGPNSPWPCDRIVYDHGSRAFKMYVEHYHGRDMASGADLVAQLTGDASVKGKDAEKAEATSLRDWGRISAYFENFVAKSLEWSNVANGGKDVIWLFQSGEDKESALKGPATVGKLTGRLPNMFEASLFMGRNKDDYVFTTWLDGTCIAKHSFNTLNAEGVFTPILGGFEPADLGGLLAKVDSFT